MNADKKPPAPSPDPYLQREIALAPTFLGTTHKVQVYSYGPNDGAPRIYIQAGLHAGEHPGILVANQLKKRLSSLAEEGALLGRVDLVPVANPIGLGQILNGEINGRFDFVHRRNFNRQFPDVSAAVLKSVAKAKNGLAALEAVRHSAATAINAWPTSDHIDSLKRTLFRIAIEADITLDLHCDGESSVHVYTGGVNIEWCRLFANRIGAEVIATGNSDDGLAFDDALNKFWADVAGLIANPPSSLKQPEAMTVELRGRADVSPTHARNDADAIINALMALNVIKAADELGQSSVTTNPPPVEIAAKDIEVIHAKSPGILSYRVDLGQRCKPGQIIAELVDPYSSAKEGELIRCTRGGMLFSRHISKLAFPGMEVCKLA
ncbi:MAG: succinylglutamate desuccinylase/aspartoacylase family protein [Pseudomonadota bacterium]